MFKHDQLATVGLAVETDVVDFDSSQTARFDGATRPQIAPSSAAVTG